MNNVKEAWYWTLVALLIGIYFTTPLNASSRCEEVIVDGHLRHSGKQIELIVNSCQVGGRWYTE